MDSYSLEAVLSLKDIGYVKKMVEAIEQAESLEKQSESTGTAMTKSFTAASVAANMITKAFSSVVSSVGSAVDRLDALTNFPKVMDTLGYSSDVAKEKISYLADVTDALPTTLNEITQSTQTLTATLGDLEKGTDTAVALNDMFLAGGQGADAASRAMTQYNQILAKGKVDQQSWNTMVEVAPGQMNQLAQSLLGASAGQRDLYQALQDGTVSVEQMNNAVIELDSNGGEAFASFHDQALGATGGIGTAWVNLQNAIVKGTADIIDRMNEAAKSASLPGLAESIDIARGYMSKFFNVLADGAGNIVSTVAPAVKLVADNFGLIVKVAGEVVAGVEAMKIIKKLSSWLDSTRSAISKAKSALDKYKNAMDTYGDVVNATATAESRRADATRKAEEADKAVQRAIRSRADAEKAATAAAEAKANAERDNYQNTTLAADAEAKALAAEEAATQAERDLAMATEAKATASAAAAAATEAETAANTLSNGSITVKTALLGVLSGEYGLVEAGQLAWNAAMAANPLGLILTGVTALIAGITILHDKFGGLSEEEQAAADAEKEFHEECQKSASAVSDTADELERASSTAKEHSDKVNELVSRYKKLSKQENLSADEKEELAGIVEQLNSNIDGLNLAFDKESGKLSQTTEQVEKKADAYNKLKEAEAVQEGLNELIEQEKDLTDKQLKAKENLSSAMDDLQKKEEAYNKALTDNVANIDVYKDAYDQAREKVTQYHDDLYAVSNALSENGRAQKEYAQEVADASAEAAQAEKEAQDLTVTNLANAIIAKRETLQQAIADHTATLDMLSEKNQETVETLQTTWSSYYDYATNMFSTLSDEITVDVDTMIANLQKNQEVISQWGDNMKNLRDRVEQMDVPAPVREGLDEMLTYLQEAGPEQAGAVAAIAGATDEQLLALGDSWSTGASTAWDSMKDSMTTKAGETAEEVQGLITDLGTSISETLEGTDWTEIGEDCMKGLAEGFEADDEVIAAAESAATGSIDAAKEKYGINSPSKEFKSIGEFCNAGLAEGLTSSMSRPVSSITTIALRLITEMRTRLQTLRDVGVQSVSMLANGILSAQGTAYNAAYDTGSYTGHGFNNGLESQRQNIIATAHSIAAAATAELAATVKQGSPSKVTRETGYWTGLGFALGMEDEIPYIEKVAKKIGNIAASITAPDFSGSSGNWNASLAIAGGNISYSMDSMRDEIQELKNAIYSQPILVNTEMKMNERVVGKTVATYVKKENNYVSQVTNALQGVR